MHNKTKKETREEDLKAAWRRRDAATRASGGAIAANRVAAAAARLEAARRGDLNSLRTLVIDGWIVVDDRGGSTRRTLLLWQRAALGGVRFLVESAGMDPESGAERTTVVRRSVRYTGRRGTATVTSSNTSVARRRRRFQTADGSTAFA